MPGVPPALRLPFISQWFEKSQGLENTKQLKGNRSRSSGTKNYRKTEGNKQQQGNKIINFGNLKNFF